ncbi:GGDEF domain-containing response regulator [Desulfatiglans anilini]|uniref:GGDEF domain-containing response regulator n=1 Tax=Desulfatiglans anilini TaxID=90728 RepID=UPI000404B0A1|nr:diguanylate cyclase [Desulfatiglans anilini]
MNNIEKQVDLANERFLLIDDNPQFLQVLQEAISRWGYRVDTSSKPVEALRMIEEGLHTFLICDLRMPHVDGLELIREARNLQPQILCFAITGYIEEYAFIDAVHAGATDFLRKPFELAELKAKIMRAILERDRALELLRLSITDVLTGLFNRRHFFAVLDQEIARASRQQWPLSLILLDLDTFKQFNDRHGHMAGDRLLENVGAILQGCIRQDVDSAYRYGGDEFAVILVDADAQVALRVGHRIAETIKERCGVSAALGFAELAEGMNAETLIALADSRLYQAKGITLRPETRRNPS